MVTLYELVEENRWCEVDFFFARKYLPSVWRNTRIKLMFAILLFFVFSPFSMVLHLRSEYFIISLYYLTLHVVLFLVVCCDLIVSASPLLHYLLCYDLL